MIHALQEVANAAYFEGFPFPALLRVAPYCARGGIRVVSIAVAVTSLSGDPTASFLHVRQVVHLLAGGQVEFMVDPVEFVVDLRVFLLRLDGRGDVAPVGVGLSEAN